MRKVKQRSILFTGVFIFVFSQAVFGVEGELPKKDISSDPGSEYEESELAVPPDLESAYEESLFQIKEGKVGGRVTSTKPEEEDGKGSDKSLQDLKYRLLEEQQQRVQRTIAEDARR